MNTEMDIMNSNIKRGAKLRMPPLSYKNNYTIIMIILTLLSLPAFVHAAGQAEWEKQVNDGFRQAHQSTQGLKGKNRADAERYLNHAESEWNKLKSNQMWYIQQQYQQQNQLNNTYLQQQNLNLLMQQQMLKNQEMFKTPSLKTINPFGDYLFHGVSLHPADGRLHGPGTIADTPALSNLFINPSPANKSVGMAVWDEKRRLENVKTTAPRSAVAQAASIKNTGLWDNPMSENAKNEIVKPYANNSNVVDLRDAKFITPKLLHEDDSKQAGSPVTESNPYSTMSDERLQKKQAALTEALRKTQEISSVNVRGYSQAEADAADGKVKAWQAVQDSATTLALGANVAFLSSPAGEINSSVLTKLNDGTGYLVDGKSMYDSANDKKWGDVAGQAAITSAPWLIKSPTTIKATPLAAIPGTVKLGIDTTFVWADYYVLYKESQRQEQLTKQIEANRLTLSKQLQEVIKEQKKRTAKSQ